MESKQHRIKIAFDNIGRQKHKRNFKISTKIRIIVVFNLNEIDVFFSVFIKLCMIPQELSLDSRVSTHFSNMYMMYIRNMVCCRKTGILLGKCSAFLHSLAAFLFPYSSNCISRTFHSYFVNTFFCKRPLMQS